MAETLHSPEEIQKTFEESTNDALVLGNSGHETDLTNSESHTFDAARSVVGLPANDEYVATPAVAQEKTASERDTQPNYKMRRIAVGVAGAAVVGGASLVPQAVGAIGELHNNSSPAFSEESTTHFTQPGDTLWGIVDQIEGIENIDKRDAVSHINKDPANTDMLKDGLQGGDVITIPVSVE